MKQLIKMKSNTTKFTLGLLSALFVFSGVIVNTLLASDTKTGYGKLLINNETKYAFNIHVQDKATPNTKDGMGVHVNPHEPEKILARDKNNPIAYQDSHFWIQLDMATADFPIVEAFNWDGPRTQRYAFILKDKSIPIDITFDREDDKDTAAITLSEVQQ